jgi:hypothetical protein
MADSTAFTRRLLGFGRDAAGELYVLANDTGTPFGATGVVLGVAPGPGTLGFDATGVVSVAESAGAVTLTVARSGGAAGAATVDFGVTGGSATAGSDYAPVSGTLSWANGEDRPKSFTIDLAGDSASESTETIEVALTNATGASLGNVATYTVDIVDDDTAGESGGGAIGAAFVALLLAASFVYWLHAARARP